MKAIFELPYVVLHEAKATAAREGRSLGDYLAEAVVEKLGRSPVAAGPKPWEAFFGAVAHDPSLLLALQEIDSEIATAREADCLREPDA